MYVVRVRYICAARTVGVCMSAEFDVLGLPHGDSRCKLASLAGATGLARAASNLG